jgi:mono/diheme cytochrome c family protein
VRATILAAGGLAGAGAAMTIAAFAGGASDTPKPVAPRAHAAADGLDVWVAQGCGSCHTFEPAGASAPIGPDLQQTLRGQNRDYVLRAIVLPGADAAPGYDPGTMPADYARRIEPADLERLTDFVLAGVRRQ